MITLNAIEDATSLIELGILHKRNSEPDKAKAAFTEARKTAEQLGPLSITGHALTVVLEDAEAAEVQA